jgi:hypothetical protein
MERRLATGRRGQANFILADANPCVFFQALVPTNY